MKHPIGFCVQGSAPEAVPAPAAPAETAAVPSVVRVFFPERGQAYSYYNDRFDLHDGDLVYVSGKLARQRGQVVAVDYNFRIRLADYERVIGAADRNVRGTFYALGAHLVALEPNVLPFRQVRGWFLPPEADGEYAVGHGPGPVYALEQLSIPAGVAEKGHAYYMENRVIYLSVDGTAGPRHRERLRARMSSRSPTRAARSARSRVPVMRRGCASTAPPCCCSCAKRWRRSTSTGRMPLPRTDISPL